MWQEAIPGIFWLNGDVKVSKSVCIIFYDSSLLSLSFFMIDNTFHYVE